MWATFPSELILSHILRVVHSLFHIPYYNVVHRVLTDTHNIVLTELGYYLPDQIDVRWRFGVQIGQNMVSVKTL